MDNRIDLTLGACARVMRPLVRLALAMGVKFPQMETLLRDMFLDEARRTWRQQGVPRPNISQLSITTGINRKAVTTKVREPASALPATEMSAASRTFTLWLQMSLQEQHLVRLPVAAAGEGPSFESVARRASGGNVHHRAILDELVRLDMAAESGGEVELRADGFVPGGDLRAMLSFLGDNGCDHLRAAVSNTLKERAPMLERAVFARGVRPSDCERIDRLARERWSQLHRELTDEMTQAVDQAGDDAAGRIRVGIYVYYEDDEDSKAAARAPQ